MPAPIVTGQELPRHGSYAQQTQCRGFWRRSDVVAFDYALGTDAGGSPILPKHEREKEDRYNRRKSQALGRKYGGPIVDRYNDHVCRIEATRADAVAGSPYAQLLIDADGAGTPLPTLMRRRLRASQVDSCAYLLCDSNVVGVFATAAEEMAASKRGILRPVSADQVIWWRDWQGQVVEAIVLFEASDGTAFAWYVTTETVQRITLKQAPGTAVVEEIGPPIAHKYGGCPLVRLMPVFAEGTEVGKDSQLAPIAECQKRVCNLESWLYEEHQYGTFTTPVFLGASADQVNEVTVGPGMGLALPSMSGSGTPAIATMGSDPAQAESLRTTLEREVAEIYRVAGLSPGNPTQAGQPESGVAKAFAFNEVEAKLSALADAAELAENTAVKRLAAGFGWSYPGDADWPDSFGIPDLAEELDRTIRTTTSNLPALLQRKQVELYAAIAFKLTKEDQTQLATELDAMAAQAAEDARILANSPTNPAGRKAGT